MATDTTAQLHRIGIFAYDATANEGKGGLKPRIVLGPDDLGQDTQMTFNISPRKMTRSSSLGTTNTPIQGTFDELTASFTMLADRWAILGKTMGNFEQATYDGATTNDGHILGGTGDSYCSGGETVFVAMQGLCDKGSNADVVFTRCILSIDDDIEIGGTDTPSVTVSLNPQPYNPNTMSGDGFPAYTYRLGAEALDQMTRLNMATGAYDPVTTSTTPTEPGA